VNETGIVPCGVVMSVYDSSTPGPRSSLVSGVTVATESLRSGVTRLSFDARGRSDAVGMPCSGSSGTVNAREIGLVRSGERRPGCTRDDVRGRNGREDDVGDAGAGGEGGRRGRSTRSSRQPATLRCARVCVGVGGINASTTLHDATKPRSGLVSSRTQVMTWLESRSPAKSDWP